MSVRRQTTSRPSRFPGRPSLGEDPGVLDRLHERSVAHLHVEHDRVGARGELLGHDRGGDERHDVDRRGHVAKRVELLVGRHEISGLADDREADRAHLLDEGVRVELHLEPGDRLELVERPAGMAEPATGHLPEGDAAGRDDRPHGEGRLVPDTARRVLVDDSPSERGAEVEGVAGADHRVRQRVRLAPGETLEVDGHAPRSHLVIGNVAARVAEDELRHLLPGELLAVSLALDQLGGADHVSLPNIRRGGYSPQRPRRWGSRQLPIGLTRIAAMTPTRPTMMPPPTRRRVRRKPPISARSSRTSASTRANPASIRFARSSSRSSVRSTTRA